MNAYWARLLKLQVSAGRDRILFRFLCIHLITRVFFSYVQIEIRDTQTRKHKYLVNKQTLNSEPIS